MENLQPGQTLGPYQIISQIGKGGMATVYKAYQAAMDRYVAVKVLPRQLAENPTFVGRFQQEVRVIARLEHPRILPVFDYGEQAGVTYLVMRYLEAGTLQDRMATGPLTLAEIDRLFTQLADALGYAHQQGVIHRDLKPSNVMVDATGNVFLTDFGIAKIIGGDAKFTQTDAIIGTPAYISPEQAQGQPLDRRSDIYALGIVLYEMVTGQVPYSADTPLAVIMKHVTGPLPLPSTVKPDLPLVIERVLLKALAKKPEERFATCANFAAAWQEAFQSARAPAAGSTWLKTPDQPVPPPGATPTVVAGRPPQRPWLLAGLLGGAGVLLTGGCLTLLLIGFLPGALKSWLAPTAPPTFVAWATEPTATQPAAPTHAPDEQMLPTPTDAPAAATLAPAQGTFAAPVPLNTPFPVSAGALSPENAADLRQLALIEGEGGGPLAWSPDGKYLAVGAYGFNLYDSQTFTLVRSLGERGWVKSFAFMPDGQAVALTGQDGVTLWRVESGGQVKIFPSLKEAEFLAISPDGQTLAAGVGQVVKLVDIASGDETATLPIEYAGQSNLAFSPDGQWLASAGGGAGQDVVVYAIASGKKIFALEGHTNWIHQVSFSADGHWLISASVDQSVKIWDLSTRLLHASLNGHTGQVEGAALSPDSRLAASASWDLTVKIWDAASGQILASLTGPTEWGGSVAFSPDGTRLASNDDGGGIRIWGTDPAGAPGASATPRAAGPIPTALPLAAEAIVPANVAQVKQVAVVDSLRPQALLFSPDGQTLWAIDSQLYQMETNNLAILAQVPDIQGNIAYAVNQRLAAAAHDGIQLYQLPGGTALGSISDSRGASHVAFSPDGGLLAAVVNESVKIWDAASGVALRTLPAGASQSNLAFSPDGSRLVAAGGVAGTDIHVWDTATWQEVATLKGHTNWIGCLVFAPGSQTLASSAVDNTLRLWEVGSGRLTRTINVPPDIAENSNQVPALAFSPDGQLLAASYGVPVFSLWQVASGSELRRFTGPTTMVRALAFSPDGKYLVTSDDALRLWGLAP